jgi:hypothetical protein
VNRVSQVTIRDLQLHGKEVSGSCNSQLATRPVHNRAAKCVAAGRGIFENLLKTQACLNRSQFDEVKLKIYFQFLLGIVLLCLFCHLYQ